MRGKGPAAWLLGDAVKTPFEQRIFHFSLLLAMGMTAFGTIMDVYYKVNIFFDVVFLGCWVLGYALSRLKFNFSAVSIVFTGIFVYLFIPYIWMFTGGSSSVMPIYIVVFLAIVLLIHRGRLRVVMVASLLVEMALMLGYEVWQAGSPMALLRPGVRVLEFALHMGVVLASMTMMLLVYSRTYERERARSEEYARTIEEHYRQQLYYMENLEEMIFKLKAERHDFNNHLGVIHGLLQSGEGDRAQDYSRHLVDTAREYQTIVQIAHPMVRAMLNYKLSAARDAGIELHMDVAVPAQAALDEFDVTVILGNLLDNAMEACAKLEEGRKLWLSMRYEPDYLVIRVENTMAPGDPGAKPRTTKADPANHGFGLRNIEYLVQRHNGFLEVGPEGGIFRAKVALLVQPPS